MASLSLDERRAILFGAASVYARVAAYEAQRGAMTRDDEASILPEAHAALQTWSRVFSPGDRDAFLRRLQWDGLDWGAVGRALSAPSLDPAPESDWTVWLDLILESAREVLAEFEHGSGSIVEAEDFGADGDEPPFIELGAAVLRAARRFLLGLNPDAYAGLAPEAQRALERPLLKDVSAFGERTLYELFRQLAGAPGDAPPASTSAPDARRYRAFVASMLEDGLSTFWVAYPVLARVTAQLVETWVESTHELVQRLETDRPAIAARFGRGADPGRVIALRPALSDPHNGRRRVAVLTFESGLRLVYKPRDVGVERALSQFLAWINARAPLPPLRALEVIERNGYGWVEFAAHETFASRGEVRRYYFQAGALAAVAHLLGATDLHMENVVATRGGPVIVDPESLMHPGRPRAADSTPRPEPDSTPPCVATGFLTFVETGADGQHYETGGLRGGGLRGSERARRVWQHLRTDRLGFVDEHEFRAPAANRVLLDGVEQRPEDYQAELIDGFTAVYRFCAERRDEIAGSGGPLEAFAGCRTRVLFRPTNQYAVLQDVLAAPKYQSSGVARSTALDVLARPFTMDRTRPAAWPLAIAERTAVDNLDIPHFTVETGGTAVAAGGRPLGDRFFARPGLAIARDRVRALSDADLAVQIAWIRRSLGESATSRFHVAAPALPEGAPDGNEDSSRHLAVAAWIGRELLDRAVDERSALTWTMYPPGHAVSEIEASGIYTGSLGPALFLAALAHVTGESSWADAARRALMPPLRTAEALSRAGLDNSAGLGVGTGVGSIVYGLRWAAEFLDDRSYLEIAADVARRIEPRTIAGDRDLDVVAGSAGAILSLLSLQPALGDRVLDRAAACGDQLLAAQVHTHWGSSWPSRDARLLAGFAHGAAGIAYALVRLYQATGRRAYLEGALRGHRYERAVFSPVHRNWPLVRSAGHLPGNIAVVMTAWCHGAPGVGLARALVHDAVASEDPEVAGEIDAALATTAALASNAGDHLCCGNMGRCDVLFTAGRRLARPSALEAAQALASKVEAAAIRRGRFQLVSPGYEHVVFDPGFFHGLSGVGYQLLRLAAPGRLPSVLAFEAGLDAAAVPSPPGP